MSRPIGTPDTGNTPRRHRMYMILALCLAAYFSAAGLSGLLNPGAEGVKKKVDLPAATPALVNPQ